MQPTLRSSGASYFHHLMLPAFEQSRVQQHWLMAVFVRIASQWVFVALITSIMWVSVALNSQPEIIAYWRQKFEHERAMNVLVAALRTTQ